MEQKQPKRTKTVSEIITIVQKLLLIKEREKGKKQSIK